MPELDVYVQPTNTNTGRAFINPWSEVSSGVAYVLFKTSEQRTRPTRVLVSDEPIYHAGGQLDGRALKLGDHIKLRREDSNVVLGVYEVCGINRADTGRRLGNVPNQLIRRCSV